MGATSEPGAAGGIPSATSSAAGALSQGQSPDASGPNTARGMTLAAALAAGDKASVPGEGAVLTPAQAREIGALLSRLTRENAAFLKARDSVVADRDAAQDRVLAMENEVELLQQQLRDMEAAVRGGSGQSVAASGKSSAVASPRGGSASRSSSRLGSIRWRSGGVAGGSSTMATVAAAAVAESLSRSVSSKKRVQLLLPEGTKVLGGRHAVCTFSNAGAQRGGSGGVPAAASAAGTIKTSESSSRCAEQSVESTPMVTARSVLKQAECLARQDPQ
jgi:hypothetical protein